MLLKFGAISVHHAVTSALSGRQNRSQGNIELTLKNITTDSVE